MAQVAEENVVIIEEIKITEELMVRNAITKETMEKTLTIPVREALTEKITKEEHIAEI